jgi:hypothetical protein
MKLMSLLTSLLVAGCAVTPGARPDSTNKAPMAACSDPFPVPRSGLTLAGDRGPQLTLDAVLNQMQTVTDLHVVVTPEISALLSKIPSGLSQPLEIPASHVYSSVENLLAQNGFVLVLLQSEQPILVGVQSVMEQSPKRAWVVQQNDLDVVADHPALIVSTIVMLSNVDARQLANSMRQIIQDPRSQQIVPVGDGNGVLLTGRGTEVAALAKQFLAFDESEGRTRAERAKQAADGAKPKSGEPAPK